VNDEIDAEILLTIYSPLIFEISYAYEKVNKSLDTLKSLEAFHRKDDGLKGVRRLIWV
jgi:hypothetical protein